MSRIKDKHNEEAKEHLQWILLPGTTVYTILRHVSTSGMMRCISLFMASSDEGPETPYILKVDYYAARALGMRIHPKHGGLVTTGCGMGMGYDLVMQLSYALHGHEGRGLTDEENAAGMHVRPSRTKYRAGYSLQHQWL